MIELVQKLLGAGRRDALASVDAIKKAAAELGYSEAEIEKQLKDLDGLPINEDDLEGVSGGYNLVRGSTRYGDGGDMRIDW